MFSILSRQLETRKYNDFFINVLEPDTILDNVLYINEINDDTLNFIDKNKI